jgi:RNA polymerase sigma factor (sigma-70 family)
MRRINRSDPGTMEINWAALAHEVLNPDEEREIATHIDSARQRFFRSCTNQFLLEETGAWLAQLEPRTHAWQTAFRTTPGREALLKGLPAQLPRYSADLNRQTSASRGLIDPCLEAYPFGEAIPENARRQQQDGAAILATLQPRPNHLYGLTQLLKRRMGVIEPLGARVRQASPEAAETLRAELLGHLHGAGETTQSLGQVVRAMDDRYGTYRAGLQDLAGHNYRLVSSIAKRFEGKGLGTADLFEEGVKGLMIGLEKYEHETGNRVGTCVTWWIRQSLQKALRTNSATGVSFKPAQYRAIMRATQDLWHELLRHPTHEEVAERSGCTVELVKGILTQGVSLDQTLDDDNGTLLSFVAAREERAVSSDARSATHQLSTLIAETPSLKPRELTILQLRFGVGDKAPQSLEEVGRQLKITKERVRQIQVVALKKMQKAAVRLGLTGS